MVTAYEARLKAAKEKEEQDQKTYRRLLDHFDELVDQAIATSKGYVSLFVGDLGAAYEAQLADDFKANGYDVYQQEKLIQGTRFQYLVVVWGDIPTREKAKWTLIRKGRPGVCGV